MQHEAQSVICPVCACEIAAGSTVDVCMACQTPHHQDCACFFGKCARFACGGRRFATLAAEAAAQSFAEERLLCEPELEIARPAAPRRLHRGILARLAAACRLIAANPSMSLGLWGMLLILSFPLTGFLATIGAMFAQAMAVLLFLARARGKESTAREAFVLTVQRGGRIVTSGLSSWLATWMPLGFGMALLGYSAMEAEGALAGLGMLMGGLLVLLGFSLFVSYVLVPVVAAMGVEEEPGSVLQRSAQLVGVDRRQTTLSMLLLCAAAGLAQFASSLLPMLWSGPATSPSCSFLALLGVSMLGKTLVLLLSTAYWLLFYLEARRQAVHQ